MMILIEAVIYAAMVAGWFVGMAMTSMGIYERDTEVFLVGAAACVVALVASAILHFFF